MSRSSLTPSPGAVGTATDPYQPIEGHYKLTRRCLEVLVASNTPFSIVTKGPMVVRDLDVLRRAAAGPGARVYLSVPTANREAWAKLEPGTAAPEQRLRAVRILSDAGIDAATRENGTVILRARSVDVMTGVFRCLADQQIAVTDFRTFVPNLEDVFLKLTGHSVRQ